METNPLYLLVAAVIVVSLGVVALQSTASNIESVDLYSNSSSTTFLGANGSTSTLTAEEGITTDTVTTANISYLNFDGAGDSINISDSNSLELSNNATWVFWIKQKLNQSNNDGITSKYAFPSQKSWEIELNNDARVTFRSSTDGVSVDTDTSTTGSGCGINITTEVDEWHLLSLTFNNGSIIYYKDGQQCDTDTNTNYTFFNSTTKVLWGYEVHNAKWLNGSLDELLILNKTLPALQIERFYNESSYGSNLGEGIPVLSYHQIETPCDVDTEVCIENFTAQMEWLSNQGYETITYDDWLAWKRGETLLPEKPIILVFDDGRLNLYTNGTPIMDTYGFVGVAGIVIQYASNPATNYMNWTQVQDLKDSGWQIASHSYSHCDLITDCNLSGNWTEEFSDSKIWLEGNLTGQNTTTFIYPFNSNNITSDYYCSLNYTVCSGYSSGTTTRQNFLFEQANLTYEDGQPYGIGLRRIIIANTTTLENFISSIDYFEGRVLDMKLDEDTGTTAYDISDYGNDGIITGASWEDDGNEISLIENLDYTLNSATGLFTLINPSLAYSLLNIDWDYNYRTTNQNIGIARLIEIFIALIILAFILLIVNYYRNQF